MIAIYPLSNTQFDHTLYIYFTLIRTKSLWCVYFIKIILGSTDNPVAFTDVQVYQGSPPPPFYQMLPCSGYVDHGCDNFSYI